MGIVVMGAVFVDIKGFPEDIYIPDGRNVGHVEYIHGGVSRNVVEDIANIELRPTFVGIVDDSALGEDVVKKLKNHKVNTDYVMTVPGGMGTWLAVFDHNGDLAGSISQRPNLMPILGLLEEKGDEIFANADSVIVEVDMDKDIIKKVVALAKQYNKKLYGVVSNMSIAVEIFLNILTVSSVISLQRDCCSWRPMRIRVRRSFAIFSLSVLSLEKYRR